MLFFHAVLTLFLLAVIYFDSTRYIIPNWICAVIVALYPAMLLLSPAAPVFDSILWSVGLFFIVFAIGAGFFVMKWLGGGDVKLLAALALWTGREATIELVIYTACLGGLLALLLMLLRPLAGRLVSVEHAQRIPRLMRYKEPLPYGIAIVLSFLILLWIGKVPGLPVAWM
jgi:prepilin peptidase CpaA